MNKRILFILLFTLFSFSSSVYAVEPRKTNSLLNTTRIEQLTGAKGTLDSKEQVFKVAVPRNDISVFA